MKFKLLFMLLMFILFFNPGVPGDADASEMYAGIETCKECHESYYESYVKTSHAIQSDSRSPAARHACETCHGSGFEHVESGGGKGVGGIVGLSPEADTTARAKNAVCLECHTSGATALWFGGMHAQKGLTCSNCHNVHAGYESNLSKRTITEVCTQCHKTIMAQLQRSSHHPIREGKMDCTDCHNPHGTVTEKLISANTINDKCWECHAEKRGPFLWQHAPVIENCGYCHTPHGSSHEKLMKAKLPYLCQTCHSNSRHPGTLYAQSNRDKGKSVYKTLNNRAYYRACMNCHNQVHGSNHPSGKSLMR